MDYYTGTFLNKDVRDMIDKYVNNKSCAFYIPKKENDTEKHLNLYIRWSYGDVIDGYMTFSVKDLNMIKSSRYNNLDLKLYLDFIKIIIYYMKKSKEKDKDFPYEKENVVKEIKDVVPDSGTTFSGYINNGNGLYARYLSLCLQFTPKYMPVIKYWTCDVENTICKASVTIPSFVYPSLITVLEEIRDSYLCS